MKLNEEYQRHIDNMTEEELLFLLRTAQNDDPLMKGETGDYINRKLDHLFKDMNNVLESE